MPIQGFECNKCRANFEDLMPADPNEEIKIECPMCGSTDVKESEAAKELLDLIKDMGRTGG